VVLVEAIVAGGMQLTLFKQAAPAKAEQLYAS
jgi:hypothetical protein